MANVPHSVDLRCYFVTGLPAGVTEATTEAHFTAIAEVAARAAAGGAGIVQVRSKPITVRNLTRLARCVALAVHDANPDTKVVIDDRIDVAAALMAELPDKVHGVHVGQDDLNPAAARGMLGPDAIIGLTTGTVALAEAAHEYADCLDYIGAGPFRPTPTKNSGRAPLGIDGYPPIVAASPVPVVAIGDVRADDVAALAPTGIAGVALVREIMHAADPESLVRQIVQDFDANHLAHPAAEGTAPRRAREDSAIDLPEAVDHIIIGAGIIGLSTAFELVSAHGIAGENIAIVDPEPISGASFYAGGMLAPAAEAQFQQESLHQLMAASAELYPDLLRRLSDFTDSPTGYRTDATFVIASDRADADYLNTLTDFHTASGFDVERITTRSARSLEPGLSPRIAGAVSIAGDHHLNPRLYTAALRDALVDAGVHFVATRALSVATLPLAGSTPDGIAPDSPASEDGADWAASGVVTEAGELSLRDATTGSVYLANGLGAADTTGWYDGAHPLQLRPVRGDILRLAAPADMPLGRVIRGFVHGRQVYVIPRADDATVVIGATSREDQRTKPSVDGVYELLHDALEILPSLDQCEFLEALTGERPGTPDDLPYLGLVGRNLVVSTGYFRHGILLSALGATVGAQLGTGAQPSVDISACAPLRCAASSSKNR